MSVGLYMDHHIHSAITAGLRRPGVDCLTAEEDGTSSMADERLLERATDLGRVFFTNDRDLLVIAADRLRTGREFAGLVFAEQLGITIGQAIADLELIAKASAPDDCKNRIEYLPL